MYIFIISVMQLPLHRKVRHFYCFLQAIESRYERENELCGCEVTFDDDSDQVLLDIDKDGVTTKEGWHIRPCVYPPLVRYTRSCFCSFVLSRVCYSMCNSHMVSIFTI